MRGRSKVGLETLTGTSRQRRGGYVPTTMTTLPIEIATALGERASEARHLRLRSGLDTPTGESHLVISGGALRVFARASMLDPLVEVLGASGARLAVSTLSSELHVDHSGGVGKISLGYGEQEQVEALIAEIGPPKVAEPEAPASPTPPTPAPVSPAFVSAPPPSPELDACRTDLLDLFQARRGALEHAASGGTFASLLAVTRKQDARLALFEAREAIARGNRDEAVMLLAHAAERTHWTPRMALGELLFDMGRYPEALGAARRAEDAGAPADVVTPLLERASRAAGNDRALARALEAKKKYVRDRAERREIADELQELQQRRERERASRSPSPPAPEKPPPAKEKARVQKHRTKPSAPSAPATQPQSSLLPWIVLAILILLGVGAALRRLAQ